ncbi:MAG: helix-turn-helix transcriptional regulator, partial [Planctomycetota bacterium]
QSDVARKLSISTSYLSLITNGKRNPNLRLSTALANILDADLQDLFPQGTEPAHDDAFDVLICTGEHGAVCQLVADKLRGEGLRVDASHGDFETGYKAAFLRPRLIVLDTDVFHQVLPAVVQRLRAEPLTLHVQILALVTVHVGKRRRKQLERLEIPSCEWDGANSQLVAEQVKRHLGRRQVSHTPSN